MKANEVAEAINDKVQAIREKMLDINGQILEEQRKILAIKDQQANIYQRIATIYLLDPPQQIELQTIKELLNKLHQEFALLEKQLQQLDKQVAQWQLKQNELQKQRTDKETERDNILTADKTFTTLINDIVQAQQTYQQITEIHNEVNKEFTSKLAGYTKDARYNYLVKRKFSEPDYKGLWIFRNLDQWLARQVNFTINYKNQKILQALLAESARRYEASKDHYQTLVATKDQKILAVEQSVELPAINKQLTEVTDQLTDYQNQRDQTYQELTDTKQGQGSRFSTIAEQLAKIMQQLTTDKLTELTLQTPSTEDDQLPYVLTELTRQIASQQQQINLIRKNYKAEEKVFGRISQLAFEFKREGMDSRAYLYTMLPAELTRQLNFIIEEKLPPKQVLKNLLNDRMIDESSSGNSALFNISSSVLSASSSSSGSSSSWSSGSSSSWSSGSSSSGGFSSSSSSGGGGFRTTDSF